MDTVIEAFMKVLKEIWGYIDKVSPPKDLAQQQQNISDLSLQLQSVKRIPAQNSLVMKMKDVKILLEQKILENYCEDCEKIRENLKSLKSSVDRVNNLSSVAQRLYEESTNDLDPASVFHLSSEGPLDLVGAMYLAHQGRRIVNDHYAILRHSVANFQPGSEDSGDNFLEAANFIKTDRIIQRISSIVKSIKLQGERTL